MERWSNVPTKQRRLRVTKSYKDLSIEECLKYDPATGEILWVRPKKSTDVGKRAGTRSWDGAYHIYFHGKMYKLHRLAWFLQTGEWPKNLIDHKDRNRDNNKWENLRECSSKENSRNCTKRKELSSGFLGVSWHKSRSKWRAYAENKHLGLFLTEELAARARDEYVKHHYKEFANLNFKDNHA